jgi:hypothetical protein
VQSLSAALLGVLFGVGSLQAAKPPDYLREIRPILKERCFACHGGLKQEGSLRVDTAAAVRAGGDSGAAVEIGKAAESLLIVRVSASDEEDRMPPEGQPLTAEEIAKLTAWINGGAKAPVGEEPEPDPRKHWAFQLPQRSEVPRVGDPLWQQNPIDVFLAAERKRLGLRPVAPVEKSLLLRRVYLDLIGLPPTRAQQQAFLKDKRTDAYLRVVDQLLASPHYGERWGRHWMDVWRYSDSYGLGKQLRYSQKHIWHWRDWIIESLNDDKGYDRMVIEMLSADEIAPTDHDTLRATGFLARNYFLFNRTTWLDNTIEHTSKAFLGLTINCTKCHDHKYDPISQKDYYRMRAIFEPHQVRLDPTPGITDLEKNGLPRVFDGHPDAPTYLHVRGNDRDPDKSEVIVPGVPPVLGNEHFQVSAITLPAEAHSPALQSFVLQDQLAATEEAIQTARDTVTKAKLQLTIAEKAAAKPQQKPKHSTPAKPDEAAEALLDGAKLIVEDDFAKANSEVWKIGDGKWEYEGGGLRQSQVGLSRAFIQLQKSPPVNFQAKIKVKITGGQRWHSVGLSFDVAEGREKLVYISAVNPGSKAQVSYKTGVAHVYPPNASQNRPVVANQVYEIGLKVRDSLVNLSVNGKHAVAYQLPVPREPGQLQLITFDAAVEFHKFELRELSKGAKLVQPTSTPASASKTSPTASVPSARLAITVAEKSLIVAQLRPDMIRAAHAADLAKHRGDAAAEIRSLVTQAAVAARRHEAAAAGHQVALAQQKFQAATDGTRAQLEKAFKAANEKSVAANKGIENPGEKYTSLNVSRKALEGPEETETSRNKPFPIVSTGRRAALARWIVHRENPLAARVAVNHIWLRHFGQPLVETVTDFGLRAPQPPQQPLLDWLAVELMEHQWSMKHLHRLMVTSATYRMSTSSASSNEKTVQTDLENAYYWRRRPVRMESQIVRDSLLHLAGALDTKSGGPTIDPKQDLTVLRRSIYFTHSRDSKHPVLSMFDDADIQQCYRRSESIVPQQALAMANSKLSLSMSRRLAKRLGEELGQVDDAAFVVAAYQTILAVAPDVREKSACLEMLSKTKQLLRNRRHPQPELRARQNLVHALVNHNDFVTIR